MSSNYNDPSPMPFGNEAVYNAEPYSPPGPPPPAKKSGCGCLGCFLGCLGVSLVGLVLLGIGAWYMVKMVPDMARKGIAQAIEQSELTPEDKKVVMEQVDRLVDGYKEGKIDMQDFAKFGEDFMRSPLMDGLIVTAAREQYLDKSGLSDEEKSEAEKTLRRFTRGAIEGKISEDQVDSAMDHISTELSNGGRQLKETVSDAELREFLAECKNLADEAMIPDELVQVDVGAELKKLVDKALGEAPADAEAPPSVSPPRIPVPPSSDSAVPAAEAPPPAEARPQSERSPPSDGSSATKSPAAEAVDPNAQQ